jgi:hypothetical protein
MVRNTMPMFLWSDRNIDWRSTGKSQPNEIDRAKRLMRLSNGLTGRSRIIGGGDSEGDINQ